MIKASDPSHTLAEDDIGSKISFKVLSTVQPGFIVCVRAKTVTKADGPSAPAGLIYSGCTSRENNDSTVSGTTSAMKYSMGSSFASAKACPAGVIAGISDGTYYVRVAETAPMRQSIMPRSAFAPMYLCLTGLR